VPRSSTIKSDLLLLLASLIWGLAFVAQRMGMEHVGPFLFNGIRFALGALTLLAVIKFKVFFENRIVGREDYKKGRGEEGKRGKGESSGLLTADRRPPTNDLRQPATGSRQPAPGNRFKWGGLLLGLILFAGASLQQVGIVYTTAGNAGFITGFYVVLVPLLGLFLGQRPGPWLWIGAVLSLAGLYFLSVTDEMKISYGDLLVLACSVFWAIHVLYVGYLTRHASVTRLAMTQYIICAFLSFIVAFIFESNTFMGVMDAAVPILYGGILSVGVAYTLQIVGQKKAPPSHAAIILSLEAVFAAVGGALILNEGFTSRKWIGCILMLMGMLLAQRTAVSGQQSAIGGQR